MQKKIFRTAECRRICVRMSESEITARRNYWLAVTVLPFFTAAAMTLIWIKGA